MLTTLRNLFFPPYCKGCDSTLTGGETELCTICRHQIPETHFHTHNDPAVQKVFYGRLPLHQATSLFYFEKKGPVQKLMHHLKYKGKKKLSEFIGNWLGSQLAPLDHYRDIDVVIPVPIHPKKLRTRGYNQVTGFGQALAIHLKGDYREDVLLKSKNTKTQVFKGRFTRSDEVYGAFYINNSNDLAGKHILLVDDIITTGATLEACGIELLKIPNVRLSIATMAIAT
tara:strand:- start:1310 stop:1990 length:681 start_codon:yes stop_codon:yes gene_type:complete